jgi:hypothetical protein
MIDNIEGQQKDTWLRRALGHETPLATTGSEAPQSSAVPTQVRCGWDPHDVWLSRIHEPRRRAAAAAQR